VNTNPLICNRQLIRYKISRVSYAIKNRLFLQNIKWRWNYILLNYVQQHEAKCRATAVLAPHIINLSTNQVFVISFMQQLLNTPRKSPQFTLNRSLGEPLNQCEHLGQNNLLSADSCIPVPYPTSLYLIYSANWNVLFV